MAASSKRKADEDGDLFKYGDAVQFSFGKKPRITKPSVVAEDLSSQSESDDENSSTSDSEDEDQWKRTEHVSSDEESDTEEIRGVGTVDG